MIDTHCHLLPGLDDGPRNSIDAVRLARTLTAMGVETVVCTPHFSRRYPTSHDLAAERLREFRTTLDDCNLELVLRLAAEVSPALALDTPLADLRERSIADRFLLVEVQPDTPTTFFELARAHLHDGGLTPVFAHPERSRAVQRRPELLARARDQGALVQIVAPSLTGTWGREVAGLAWALLEDGHADLLASDAHGRRTRGSELREAIAHVRTRLGQDVVSTIASRTPAFLLDGVHPRERE